MGRHYRVMTFLTESRQAKFISGSGKRKLTETLKDYISRSVFYQLREGTANVPTRFRVS